MTGFKEGATPSGFDDDDDSGDGDDENTDAPTDNVDTVDELANGTNESGGEQSEPAAGERESGLPWIYQREGARSDRPVTKQLHYQQKTAQRETAFRATVEGHLDENIPLADLREAAMLVAMDHPDEVAAQLREWGYDYE